jgi:hypothetical protein
MFVQFLVMAKHSYPIMIERPKDKWKVSKDFKKNRYYKKK